ncbi:Na(+)-translocating NADH-quinone reductase subunit A [Marinoscillum furvescens]|uniref:Na(+)-translocating NADH-quinone reductase subunit A n=1 Tax=Marinoscillum furvescens DSM 4134 TaxID=1122208 RepID=A0A3D9KX23_MARFU|nr:Na(+)-translocating NADH-quinone reductase subunit A [Marinoscillum furvescens]RED93190.1 Na(+)-translocating NADH:ubiquinone oxidoreductase A subunit [Marinoscillum furvescens DSM 4134]
MSKTIKLKKGFDINLAGKPEKKISGTFHSETYALKPTDFADMSRPKLLVKEGDTVKAGTPILYDKMTENIRYCAPVSGEVVEIKRGEKRKLLEIKLLADKEVAYEAYKSYSSSDLAGLSKEEAADHMQKGGVWPNVIQRPFGVVADPEVTPKAIFISAFDTHPLAPDVAYQLGDKEQFFQAGIDVLKKFTSGKVHLNIDANAEVAQVFAQAQGVELNKISGPHPAGNVGVQIHHIDPINKGDVVWTVAPYGVAQIGQLFLEGKYDASKLVAITGSEVSEPAYVKTYAGAQLEKLFDNVPTGNLRFISGNVLTGENVGKAGYLGFYHNQVTVIPEGDEEEFLGWLKPTTSKLSFHKAIGLLSFLNGKKEFKVDTNTHGEERSFVVSGAFEKVLPMDILPTYLFKAILAEDYDDMEGLGIFELVEEDVALCEFIDPSKHELQKILREGLDLIKNS